MQITSRYLESFEARRHLSASAQLADGQLSITGTSHGDKIVVQRQAVDTAKLDIQINGDITTFALADVSKIKINGLSGSDSIGISEENGAIFANATIYGGVGDDSITSGSGNDILLGGAGNDQLSGGAGDDAIYGQMGNDVLRGGADDDLVRGDEGNDTLLGNEGSDNLDGGSGKDNVKVGSGDDSVATDTSHTAELRGATLADVQSYTVPAVDDLPPEIQDAAETHVPGARTIRIEHAGDNYAIIYRFGTDPALYKAIVSDINGNLDLVTREISPVEARAVAATAFNSVTPNIGVVSINQLPHVTYNVRYRALDGSLQVIQTTNIVWSVDNESDDLNNNGFVDHMEDGWTGNNNNGNGGGN